MVGKEKLTLRVAAAAGAAAVLALAACAQPAPAPPAPQPPAGSACQEGPAQFAVGQAASEAVAARALRAAGAQRVRWIRPGQVVTMEFDMHRLTLELDGSGRIARVRCG